MVRRRIVNPFIGVRIAAGELYRRLGELADPAGSDPAVLADVSVQVARRRPKHGAIAPCRVAGAAIGARCKCAAHNALREFESLTRHHLPVAQWKSVRFRGAWPRVRLSPGRPNDREEPAWDGNGFWPRYDVVRLHAPEHRAREANEELHRTFNPDTVGSNPTARTNCVHVVKRSTPQSAKLLFARSNRAVDSMPGWLVRTSAPFVKRIKPVRIRPRAPHFSEG